MKLKVSAFMVSAVLTTNSLKTVSFLLVYLMKMTDSVVSIASLTSRFHMVADFCRHAMTWTSSSILVLVFVGLD